MTVLQAARRMEIQAPSRGLRSQPGGETQDRAAFFDVLRLVVRPRPCRPGFRVLAHFEAGVAFEQLLDDGAVLEKVGGEEEVAARFEEAQHQIDRVAVEQPPLVMPQLGPGVGEVDVDRRSESLGQESRENVEGLAADDGEVA